MDGRVTYMFMDDDQVSELEIYSLATPTECHYAYTLHEYEI